MQIAPTERYLSKIFGPERERFCKLPIGGFIENTLGQHMVAVIRRRGLEAHRVYAMFLRGAESGTAMVRHMDSHDRMNGCGENRKFKYADGHMSEDGWDEIEGFRGAAFWLDSLETSYW
eukprot:CAMPEP_0174905488 /NCGR_PEP_ID=MMETSP0167-20121228/53149_1 /TAXON_ID=38298 /ORGANISM="Rhodella maculata, Strain CCMP736" /LENGTH=118 /DNA_ID=CAMNT_0016148433 /DNA_START=41 /DNA_END=394 /DNA_ORIENTATION=+